MSLSVGVMKHFCRVLPANARLSTYIVLVKCCLALLFRVWLPRARTLSTCRSYGSVSMYWERGFSKIIPLLYVSVLSCYIFQILEFADKAYNSVQ